MNSVDYAAHMEMKLINQFRESFAKKMGYQPIVIPRYLKDCSYIHAVPLDELIKYFKPFLPIKCGFVVPLKSKRRFREIVELRFIYCYLGRKFGNTLESIGGAIGFSDHTTVIHSIQMFKTLLETNDEFAKKFHLILAYIKEQQNTSVHESSVLGTMPKVRFDTESVILD